MSLKWPGMTSGSGQAVAWLNSLLRACKASEIKPGRGYNVRNTPEGSFLDIDFGSGGISAKRLRFKSSRANYIICRTWDGTTEGTTDIKVAKPAKLRNSITSEVLDGTTITYTYTTTGSAAYVERTASGASSETQRIVPRYILNDEIWAIGVPVGANDDTSPTPQPLTILDLNIDARAWAAQTSA